MAVVQIITYASVAVFVIAVVSRFVKLATLPMHLRWELYPVAHEKGKAKYGGSYLEEPEWWTKPREKSLVGEMKVMVPEIMLLAGVWEHNKSHWLRSFPFHFGLYLLIGTILLLLAGGVASAAGAEVGADAAGLGGALHHVTVVVGWVGIFLALIGTLALLGRRLLNSAYREYTKKSDYLNLALFLVALAVSLLTRLVADPGFVGLRGYFERLVTFDLSAGGGSALLGVEVALASILVAYIPLTHMSHFFTKWFMYHDIRWSDEPNIVKGGPIEKKLLKSLSYPVSWSAAHIAADGKKNWVDVATSDAEEAN
ncbi:MAG: respiratory nitrate reductase subunit gamma [Planctomycetota bacterium]|jgi:nitrate reductase gamma subunit